LKVNSLPIVVVIAGPNGAGKSTSARHLLQDALAVHEFVNADAIAIGLSAFHPERVALAAGRLMLERMKALGAAGLSFAFETTLASRTFAPWLRRLREEGYHVHLAMLTLPSPELAISRVATRVRLGGHQVPENVIRRRFVAGLRNFFELYRDIAQTWQVFDNSQTTGPVLLASGGGDHFETIVEPEQWVALKRKCGVWPKTP